MSGLSPCTKHHARFVDTHGRGSNGSHPFMELAVQGPARGGSFIAIERGALSVSVQELSVSKQIAMIILSEVSQEEKDKYHMISLVKVKVAQLCLTVCDPIDYAVHGILQARILEWVALSFSRGSSQRTDRTQVSRIAGRFLSAEPQGKPKNTGEDSQPFSSGSSQPRNRTRVSCIAGRFFTNFKGSPVITCMWNLKYDTNEPIYETETESQA